MGRSQGVSTRLACGGDGQEDAEVRRLDAATLRAQIQAHLGRKALRVSCSK